MLTSDEVIWGYRYLLNRDPEGASALESHMRTHDDWRRFRQALLKSAEFSRNSLSRPLTPKWVAAEIFGGKRLIWLDLMDDYVSRGCLFDSYEAAETELVRKHLKAGQVFLDIGANIGWFTLLASTIVGEKGHVHAFEPRRPTVDYLRRSVSANALNSMVTVHGFGLDRAAGEQRLGWAKGTNNPGSSALVEGQISDRFDTIEIQVAALDALRIDRVDFVKMDVEGAEMRVLEGGVTTIEVNRPIVLSEIIPSQLQKISGASSDDFFSWFSSRGYRGFIADAQRNGVEIKAFPADWYKSVINVVLIPE